MSRIRDFFKKLSDWIFVGKRLPLLIAIFVIVAVTVTVIIVTNLNDSQNYDATVYVTIEGIEGVEIENRPINIEDGDSVINVFSLKYEDVYESFGRPLIRRNEFYSLLGVEKTPEKSFHVTIDGKFDTNLEQAYLYDGQIIKIAYY